MRAVTPPASHSPKRSIGATLIEMMVSLFVMGVGLMGVLALQTQSVRFNHQAYSYSQAVFLAQDILESMRTNRGQAINYQIKKEQTVTATTNCQESSCTPQQLARWDLNNWLNNINKRLPGGTASISLVDDLYTITIEFDVIRFDDATPLTKQDAERQEYILKTGL